MAWLPQDIAVPGQYVLVEKIDGIWIDPLGSVKGDELLARVRQYAQGWTPLSIDLDYGFAAIGGYTRFFGKVDSSIPSSVIASQVRAAVDSFWTIAASDFSVSFSNSLDPVTTKPSEWSGTLQLIATAVIVVAVVYGIKQIREISE